MLEKKNDNLYSKCSETATERPITYLADINNSSDVVYLTYVHIFMLIMIFYIYTFPFSGICVILLFARGGFKTLAHE